MSSDATPKATPFDSAIAEVESKMADLTVTLAMLLRLKGEHQGNISVAFPAASRGGDSEISHDSFFNMTIGDAAKKYLGMVKATKSTAVIANALEQGGLKHSSKNFATTVRSILGPREDFTRVPNGDWGLTEWYGRKKLRAEKPKKKRRARAKISTESPSITPVLKTLSIPLIAPRTPTSPLVRVADYRTSHPDAQGSEIAEKLGLRPAVVGLMLSKLKKATATA